MHKCIGHNENGSKKQVHSNKWMHKKSEWSHTSYSKVYLKSLEQK